MALRFAVAPGYPFLTLRPMNKRVATFAKDQIMPVLACFGLAYALGATGWLQRLENTTLDQVTQFRASPTIRDKFFADQPIADPRVVTMGIDDSSIETYGRWPWDRRRHAKFMHGLSFVNPPVIAWDILFTESSEGNIDDILQAAAEKLEGRVIFGAYTTDDNPEQPEPVLSSNLPLTRVEGDVSKLPTSDYALRPVPQLQKAGLTAFVDTPPGQDGVRRTVPLLQRVGGQIYPSLSLQSLMLYGKVRAEQVRIVLGEAIFLEGETFSRRIPINERGLYFVNYRYALDGCNALPFAAITEDYYDKYVNNVQLEGELPALDNTILIVGQLSTGLSDNGVTPFGAETPLVLVHANVIDNVLNEDYASVCPRLPLLIGCLVLGVLGLFFFDNRSLAVKCAYALAVAVLYVAVAVVLWTFSSFALPLLWPFIGFVSLQIFMIGRQVVREQRAKQQIKGMFGTYVSPDLVNRMIDSGQSPELGGHEENITAYFSDIQSFSTFSEKLPPDKLVVLMNDYLSACTDIIQEEGGTLDKYIGDAVVAMFGAPLPLPDHAFRACVASQRIHVKLLEMRNKWKSEGDQWPQIVHEMQSRIGMNSGPVIVGNMGSRTRFNYTMMGDNVNLAARMESGAKSWGVYTMCAEATRIACQRDGGDRVVFRGLGRIVVKGRSTAVPIYEVVGLKENVSAQTHECIQLFEQGLARYYARDWEGALACFEKSKELEPNQPGVTPGVSSNPSKVYINIVKRYQIAPPPDSWEGEYVMTEK
jgi:adenylate cyclase